MFFGVFSAFFNGRVNKSQCSWGVHHIAILWFIYILFVFWFLAFDFCRFCVVIRFFHPRHNGQWPPTSNDFYPRFYSLHFLTILILEKEPVFSLFNYSVPNKGTSGTIFIAYLVWRGLWLGIEPGTSRTRSQHYTTRLSRRRFGYKWFICFLLYSI